MVNWSDNELDLIRKFSGKKYSDVLNEIPVFDKKWKCYTCSTILKNSDLVNNKCPVCEEIHLTPMCPIDHNGCRHTVVDRIEYCPVCKQPVCPECGDHSVIQISRVTGYLQDVGGWNAAKQQELKDRIRSNLSQNGEMVRANSFTH